MCKKFTNCLQIITALGALILLISWLFQHLYAETITSEQAAINNVENQIASHVAAIPVLDAIKEIAGNNEVIRKKIESINIHNVFLAYSRYSNSNLSLVCDGYEYEVKWIDNPLTIEEKCSRLAWWARDSEAEIRKLQDEATIKEYLILPEDEFQEKLTVLEVTSTKLISEALLIKKQRLSQQTNRNRIIFIVLYITGSVLVVGAQILKVFITTNNGQYKNA